MVKGIIYIQVNPEKQYLEIKGRVKNKIHQRNDSGSSCVSADGTESLDRTLNEMIKKVRESMNKEDGTKNYYPVKFI